jgi:hypothetical protein
VRTFRQFEKNAELCENYERKRQGFICIAHLKKTHQRPFVGLVFWPLHALAGLTHKLSAFDASDSNPIRSTALTFLVNLTMER